MVTMIYKIQKEKRWALKFTPFNLNFKGHDYEE